ncbi:MAG: hypothetical protein AB1578_20935 [Thermodesulfobacteriota bacterium]
MTVTIPVTTTRELAGVNYDRQKGALCPKCGFGRPQVYTTRPWEEGFRVRFHQCQNCGTAFKSLETDGLREGGRRTAKQGRG